MSIIQSNPARSLGPMILLVLSLAGCAGYEQQLRRADNYPPGIPTSAILVSYGQEKQVFQVIDVGRAYVYDADVARVIAATHVEPGQRLVVDSRGDKLTVEGVSLLAEGDAVLVRSHTYRIYFDPRDKSATTRPTR